MSEQGVSAARAIEALHGIGTTHALIIPDSESRLLYEALVTDPDIDVIKYLPRVTVPVLQMNGRMDGDFRYETDALPFFQLIGTPDEHKKHALAPPGPRRESHQGKRHPDHGAADRQPD